MKSLRHLILLFVVFPLFLISITEKANGYSYEDYYNTSPGYEVIDLFESTIYIQKDGSLFVTEEIEVYAAQDEIKHGIYRDYPTRYSYKYILKKEVDFEIIRILRDGSIEPYHTEKISNGIRIYIGDEYSYVPIGYHTYEITYKVTDQIGFFKNHDELYYNITGNDWSFPINTAQAYIYLPDGIPLSKVTIEGYTGPYGSKGESYKKDLIDLDPGNEVLASIVTTRTLQPEEGLTVAVTWPKGYVQEPSLSSQVFTILRSNILLLANLTITVVLFFYYLIVWLWIGRDPKGRTIIPQFKPPKGISPAEMRYINRMGFDNKHITAALVNAASQGFISINELNDKFTIMRNKKDLIGLSPEEASILDNLFKWTSGTFTFKQSSHNKIREAIQEFQKVLEMQFNKRYVLKNTLYLLPGVIFTTLLQIPFILTLMHSNFDAIFAVLWLLIWSLGTYVLIIKQGIPSIKNFLLNKKELRSLIKSLFSIVFISFFVLTEIIVLGAFSKETNLVPVLFLFIQIIIHIIFFHSLKARTIKGRKVQDHIEGFQMFLRATEKERMKILHKKIPRTIKEYEKFLPYAIALDMETKWMRNFKTQIDEIESTTGQKYSPHWYTGSSFRGSSFGSSLSGSLSSSISSSSAAPGSSSGAGGGGGSGGGGGGGGGGGW